MAEDGSRRAGEPGQRSRRRADACCYCSGCVGWDRRVGGEGIFGGDEGGGGEVGGRVGEGVGEGDVRGVVVGVVDAAGGVGSAGAGGVVVGYCFCGGEGEGDDCEG